MLIKQRTDRKGKERITLILSATTKAELKVMRSIALANLGEKIRVSKRPLVELEFKVDRIPKIKNAYFPPANTKPEYLLEKPPAFDVGEEEELTRAIQARAIARSFGIKIPISIARKWFCRCGLFFYNPNELIDHRTDCPSIHKDNVKIIQRSQTYIDKHKAVAIVKEKEQYPCRCGHIFPNKSQLTRHQKLCKVLEEATEDIVRSKAYLERQKNEGRVSKHSRRKRQEISLDKRTRDNTKGRKSKRTSSVVKSVQTKAKRVKRKQC
jgi:CDGSH-type Zn-finger protein